MHVDFRYRLIFLSACVCIVVAKKGQQLSFHIAVETAWITKLAVYKQMDCDGFLLVNMRYSPDVRCQHNNTHTKSW